MPYRLRHAESLSLVARGMEISGRDGPQQSWLAAPPSLALCLAPKLTTRKPVFNLHVTEVAPALANYTTPEPFLNLTLRLDHRGHIAAVNAAIVSNVIPAPASDASASTSEGVAGALKGLFGKKDAKDGDATVEGEEEEEKADEAKEGKDSKKSKKEKKEKEKREKDKREKREKVVVKFRETYPAQRPMGGEEKRSTAARYVSLPGSTRSRRGCRCVA